MRKHVQNKFLSKTSDSRTAPKIREGSNTLPRNMPQGMGMGYLDAALDALVEMVLSCGDGKKRKLLDRSKAKNGEVKAENNKSESSRLR